MADLLVDTDVFIDHLRGAHRFRARRHRVFYSVVTRAELFAGRGADEAVLIELLAPFREVSVDREIAELAGRLRRTLDVPLPDALIASTALTRSLTLVTRNVRHFRRIATLKVRAPA